MVSNTKKKVKFPPFDLNDNFVLIRRPVIKSTHDIMKANMEARREVQLANKLVALPSQFATLSQLSSPLNTKLTVLDIYIKSCPCA